MLKYYFQNLGETYLYDNGKLSIVNNEATNLPNDFFALNEFINNSAITYNEENMLIDNPNVIFIDPPWGGNEYKNIEFLKIKFGDLYIEEFVIDIFKKFTKNIDEYLLSKNNDNNNNNNFNKFIVLKLPKNFDIENFYYYIKNNTDYSKFIICSYLYILNKMFLIVCEYNKI